MDIVSFDEAFEITQGLAISPRTEWLDIWSLDTTTRFAAADVHSPLALPTFDRAMMDGYAIHRADLDANRILTVIESIAAGDGRTVTVHAGQAVRVRTGAPVPAGAAAVIRQEWVDVAAQAPVQIRTLQKVRDGESIQHAGDDLRRGDVVLRKNDVIDGQSRAVLRAAGVRQVQTYAPCKIAILCTGSELLSTHTDSLPAGKVFAASEPFLRSDLEAAGAQVVNVEYIQDDLNAIAQRLHHFVDRVDYVILTGGASVGDTDYAKRAIASLRSDDGIRLSRIWMRPGAPFVARRVRRTSIFALSGNPAACFVQLHALVLPAVRRTMGRQPATPFPHIAKLADDVHLKPVKHVRLLRSTALMDGSTLIVRPLEKQSSGSVTGLAHANTIIRLDESTHAQGTPVPILFTRPGLT